MVWVEHGGGCELVEEVQRVLVLVLVLVPVQVLLLVLQLLLAVAGLVVTIQVLSTLQDDLLGQQCGNVAMQSLGGTEPTLQSSLLLPLLLLALVTHIVMLHVQAQALLQLLL